MRREACWDAASTEVERELKSMRAFVRVAGAKVVGGSAWRVLGVGSRGPRVVVCSWDSHPAWAVCTLNSCLALSLGSLLSQRDYAFGGNKQKRVVLMGGALRSA